MGKTWLVRRRCAAALAVFMLSPFATAQRSASAAAAWPSYNMTYDSQRYSPLAQITTDNVGELRPACETQVGDMGPLESGLLVIGRRLYLTTPRTTLAIDAVTCEVLWRHVHAGPGYNFNPSNRGPAYADGRLFRGTADATIIALDAATGRELWKVQGGQPEHGEMFSAAPIVWRGRVYIGTTGGDWGGKSRIMAYDARDGHELWRFDVIPKDGEPGADSWQLPPGATRAGGSTWSSYSLDPVTGELFVATGNPAPALAPNLRAGDNLYTDSVVVLDAATGKLKWYVQPLPADALDYDMASAPMLYRDGRGRDLIAAAGKDGYLYLIDRASHRRIAQVAVTTIANHSAVPTVEGIRACPGVFGGVEWNGPAFDARDKAIIVGAVDMCMLLRYHGGDLSNPAVSFGTIALPSTDPHDTIYGWVTAVDGTTAKTLWRYRAEAPIIAGVTVTAGGLVFTGDSYGSFLALDSATGRVLLKTDTGGTMAGGVVTYDVAGRQYVAYTAGGLVRGNFVKQVIEPKVVIATLGNAGTAVHRVVLAPLEALPPPGGDASHTRGAALYANLCTLCHGAQGEGLTAPKLRGVAQRSDTRPLAAIIEDPKPGMARFYPNVLNDGDVAALVQFLDGWQ